MHIGHEITSDIYFEFLKNIMVFKAVDLFKPSIQRNHNIFNNDIVVAIDGKDVDLNLLRHNEVGSKCLNFRFFYLRRSTLK